MTIHLHAPTVLGRRPHRVARRSGTRPVTETARRPSLVVAGVRRDEPSGYRQYRGSLSVVSGSLFEVVDTAARIVLTRVRLAAGDGRLLEASTRGDLGVGTHAELVGQDQRLVGSVHVDAASTAALVLRDGSRLIGTVDGDGTARSVNLTLDASSTWTPAGTSHVDRLRGLTMNGPTVVNIHGHGHTVHYRAATNPTLGARVYPLAHGGRLVPR